MSGETPATSTAAAGTGGRRAWKERLQDLTLEDENLSDVCRQQNFIPNFIFCFYRTVVAGYFFSFLIYILVDAGGDGYGAKVLIYLTILTFIEVTLYFCVSFVNVFMDYITDHRRGADLQVNRCGGKFRYQLQWLLFNISVNVCIIVILVWWPILRPKVPKSQEIPLHIDISIHLLPCIICLVDLFLTKVHLRFVHVLYPALYLFAYLLFTVIYWAAGGTDPSGNRFIYPTIDFGGNPGIAVATVFGVATATFLAQGFLKLLYILRRRCLDTNVSERVEEQEPLVRDRRLRPSEEYA
ncbi:protein rolling stone-like [Diadema antillarum]|uniref:protein rolling stone-like n=1 Tax=Diadema antillarum TaxID=105358 RepID=UPI003A897696